MNLDDAFVTELEDECGGTLSFVIRDLNTGQQIARNADQRVFTASVYKLFVLLHIACAVEEGVLDWQQRLILSQAHQSFGTGVLKVLTPGLSLTLHDACFLMTAVSDNTAANMLLELVGVAAVNQRLRRFGIQHTELFAQTPEESPGPLRLPLASGDTTPHEVADLLTQLSQHSLGFPDATRQTLALLAAQQDRTGTARHLPPTWAYAGKTGADPHLRTDVGIVTSPSGQRYVLALFCQGLPQVDWSVDNPGTCALSALTRRALNF